jgi:hypothetical protein
VNSPCVGAASPFGVSVSDLRFLIGLGVGWKLLLGVCWCIGCMRPPSFDCQTLARGACGPFPGLPGLCLEPQTQCIESRGPSLSLTASSQCGLSSWLPRVELKSLWGFFYLCPDLFLCGGFAVEGLFFCVWRVSYLFLLWRVCCLFLVSSLLLSFGGLFPLFSALWCYCVLTCVPLVYNIFWGSILWQNCPTVHIDRDQTLEV